ncbi:MAG: hypothetical protein ACXVZT_00315 [Terriglobales bacterium]
MKSTRFRFCFFLFYLCVLCGSSFAVDRTAFTFTHYDLEVRIDPSGSAIAARGKLRVRNDSSTAQRNLTLQISSALTWRLIELNGKPLQYVADKYTTDIDHTGAVSEAVVALPSAVPPKASVELEVGYSGEITKDATRLTRVGIPSEVAAHSDWDQVAEPITAIRGIGYVTWYPVSLPAASMSDNSLFPALDAWKTAQQATSMRVSLCWVGEENLTVIANGRPEGVTRHAAGAGEDATTNLGCSIYTYAPVANTVPTFAVAEYSALARPVINVFYLPQQAAAAQEYALAAEKVLPFETEWFGAPKTKVQVVQLAAIGDAPFESGPLLFTPLELTERSSIELRMIHQLTHASFSAARPWIEEGLAHFAQALDREQQSGRAAALSYMKTLLPPLQAAEAGTAPAPDPGDGGAGTRATHSAPGLITSTDEIMYRVKAMYVWWMLRDMMGDAALQRALKKYRAADDKDTAYMPHLVEQAARRNLEWFFDDWLYRDRGLPDFRVDAVFPRATLNGTYVVTVTVADDGQPAAEVPVFVRAEGGGERTKRVLVKGKSKAVERIEVPIPPAEVWVNDGSVPESNMNNNSFTIAPAK